MNESSMPRGYWAVVMAVVWARCRADEAELRAVVRGLVASRASLGGRVAA